MIPRLMHGFHVSMSKRGRMALGTHCLGFLLDESFRRLLSTLTGGAQVLSCAELVDALTVLSAPRGPLESLEVQLALVVPRQGCPLCSLDDPVQT